MLETTTSQPSSGEQIFDRSIVLRSNDLRLGGLVKHLEAAGMSRCYELMPGNNDAITKIIASEKFQNDIFGRSLLIPIGDSYDDEDLTLARDIHESTKYISALKLNPIIVIANRAALDRVVLDTGHFDGRALLLDNEEPGPHTTFEVENHLNNARLKYDELFR